MNPMENCKKSKEQLKAQDRYDMADLVRITELLRAPDGCSWDREQTHKSVRKCVIEEAYEVAEAIDNEDFTLLREELGDLLFQAVFHAQMAQEAGRFDFDDVISDVAKKMVERHPHVFGEVRADDAEQALSVWDSAKRAEKKHKDTAQAMDAVARTLPALMRAQKLIHKSGYTAAPSCENEAQLAGALFDLCAQADRLGVDAEQLLDAKNEAFLRDFCEKAKG